MGKKRLRNLSVRFGNGETAGRKKRKRAKRDITARVKCLIQLVWFLFWEFCGGDDLFSGRPRFMIIFVEFWH